MYGQTDSLSGVRLGMPMTAGPSPATEAANRAAAAFGAWSALPGKERQGLLGAMRASLLSARDRLVDVAAVEIGASPGWIDFNIDLACQTLDRAGELLPLLEDRVIDDPSRGTRATLQRQPVGVVLGFAPWNAPVVLAVRAVAAPLLCGNTVVLKASEHCPETHCTVIEALTEAGLVDGVANVVRNSPEESAAVTEALIAHPAIRRINFTGSTRVGRIVAAQAAEHLKRCLLELSDKAPLIVLEDADLDAAAAAAAFGAFFNQGQICMSTERILVHEAVADGFAERLVARAGRLHAADPARAAAPLGRLVSAEAASRVRGLIDDALDHGAQLLIGGDVDGAVMQPAVLDRVTPAMRLYHEESFGPVAALMRVADAEEAVSVANDSVFGLTAAVFSADTARARAVADRLETGIVQINGPTVCDDPAMPFGGMKGSGYGRFGGAASIDEFTELRWIAEHASSDPARFDNLMS